VLGYKQKDPSQDESYGLHIIGSLVAP